MIPCFHQGKIYAKRKLRAWRDQKCIPLVGAITQLICADRQNTACRERRYWAQNGKLRKLGRTYRHGTVFAPRKYIKRKLRAWRDQKFIPLVCVITPLTCAGRQSTPLEGGGIGPRTESCLNWDGPIAMVPCLHQGNIYTKTKQWAWREQKCIRLVGAITPLTCASRQNTPSGGKRYRAQNGKLPKLGLSYRHATALAPWKYLYQKKAKGMERPEMYSASRCNNPTYLYGPLKYPFWREAIYGPELKVA